jgi:hypothetical protein
MLFSTGCSSVPDLDNKKLTEQVQDLQSENASLKAQLAILKDSFAQRKVGELKSALAGSENIAIKPQLASSTGAIPSSTSTITSTLVPSSALPTAKSFSDLSDCQQVHGESGTLTYFDETQNLSPISYYQSSM